MHAIADERGCCLRDMDFLVKKFQLLVPKEPYNCSYTVIFLRTAAKELSFLSLGSLKKKKLFKKRELNLTRHFAKPFFSIHWTHDATKS